jgi:hypothetical protein
VKVRRFQNAESDGEADADQNQTQCKRNAPAPGQKLRAGHLAEGKHREVRKKQTAGHAELRPRRDQPARVVGAGPFHRHQNRAAPLAADAYPLDETKSGENHCAPDADALIRRDERDQEGRGSHQQQRCNQRRLAADAVAVVAKNSSAHRARNEPHGIDRKGFRGSDPGIGLREEQLCEDEPGEGVVQKEVVPLDRGADGRGDHGPAKLEMMVACTQRGSVSHGEVSLRPMIANRVYGFGG